MIVPVTQFSVRYAWRIASIIEFLKVPQVTNKRSPACCRVAPCLDIDFHACNYSYNLIVRACASACAGEAACTAVLHDALRSPAAASEHHYVDGRKSIKSYDMSCWGKLVRPRVCKCILCKNWLFGFFDKAVIYFGDTHLIYMLQFLSKIYDVIKNQCSEIRGM